MRPVTVRAASLWRWAWRPILGLFVATGSACKTGPDLSTDYGQSAAENYDLAVGEFADEDWEEAISYADFVRVRFPFSRQAVDAELLIARAEFKQGNYGTSREAFKQFAKLHPTHRHVRNGWVTYMVAASSYMDAPTSFFLLPPDHERDQSELRETLEELDSYFAAYRGSPTEKDAEDLRNQVRRRLLAHELYVARYYLKRKQTEAAIGRLEAAHDAFAGIGRDAEVLFLLGVTYLRMDEIELSRATFAELVTTYPTLHQGQQARIYLRHLYDTYGPADPKRPRPDRSPPMPVAPPRPKNKKVPTRPEAVEEAVATTTSGSRPASSQPAASPTPATQTAPAPTQTAPAPTAPAPAQTAPAPAVTPSK